MGVGPPAVASSAQQAERHLVPRRPRGPSRDTVRKFETSAALHTSSKEGHQSRVNVYHQRPSLNALQTLYERSARARGRRPLSAALYGTHRAACWFRLVPFLEGTSLLLPETRSRPSTRVMLDLAAVDGCEDGCEDGCGAHCYWRSLVARPLTVMRGPPLIPACADM